MVSGKWLEAEILLSRASWNAMRSWSMINSLRRVAKAGLPFASQIVTEENTAHARTELIKGLFPGEEPESLAKFQTDRCLQDAQYAVDAASLVFAHSITDATAYDYCRVTALACPSAWEDYLLDRRVTLGSAKAKPFDALFEDILESYLPKEVEGWSLLQKADRLHAICKPPPGWQANKVYVYDRSRLRRLDEARHSIVHNPSAATAIGDVESEKFFLNMTYLYLLSLIKDRLGIAVNPAHVFRGT